jgi:hypothetical protein
VTGLGEFSPFGRINSRRALHLGYYSTDKVVYLLTSTNDGLGYILGDSWRPLVHLGDFWRPLVHLGDFWRPLVHFGRLDDFFCINIGFPGTAQV